ncbi:MAG: redoxin domain-containing protein [Gemmatimonadetes bacterium]|nr:redoxin domain-containing protein [Gemmatimonadota bacterium]
MNWSKLLWPASIVPILGLLAYGLTRDPNIIESPLPGRVAPGFSLESLQGERLSLAELNGKVVVVNFWASWCLACEDEHPYLVEAEHKYAADDVRIVGIIYQDSRSNAERYMRRMGGNWPNLIDPGSRTAIDYGVYGVPETFFIDRNGVVAYKQIGPVNRTILDTWIPRLLSRSVGDSLMSDTAAAVGRSKGYERRPPRRR